MVTLTYLLKCRNCLHQEAKRQVQEIKNAEEKTFKFATEFQLQQLVEKWVKEDKICENCQSKYLEVFDINVEKRKLFDYEILSSQYNNSTSFLFMLSIDKIDNNILPKFIGRNNFRKHDLIAIFKFLSEKINDLNENDIKNSRGNFTIAISGKDEGPFLGHELKIEKMQWSGFNKNEINEIISDIQKQFIGQINE
jgi:hypothetical protein